YVVNHRIFEMTSMFRDAYGGSPVVFGVNSGVMITRIMNWLAATHAKFALPQSYDFDAKRAKPYAQTTYLENVLEQVLLAQGNEIPNECARAKDIALPDGLSDEEREAMSVALFSMKNRWWPQRTVISATKVYGGNLPVNEDKPLLLMPRIETRDKDTPYTINEFFIENDILTCLQRSMLEYLPQHFPINGTSEELDSRLPFQRIMSDRFAVAVDGIDALVSADMFYPEQSGREETVASLWRSHLNELVLGAAERLDMEGSQQERLRRELEVRSYFDRSLLLTADGSPYPEGTLGVSTGHLMLDFYARLSEAGYNPQQRGQFMQRFFTDCFDASLHDPSVTFARYYVNEFLIKQVQVFKGWIFSEFLVKNSLGRVTG
ncbi:MAG: hypothetical protein KDD62_07970, partial [Bdellovibrionales bacterium]|nr:hypothetical protein [Bdellovibrionales bacterium]